MSVMESIDCRESIVITVPGKVMTKGSMRWIPNRNPGGMPVPKPIDEKNAAWQSRVSAAAMQVVSQAGLYLFPRPVRLEITYCFARPKNQYKDKAKTRLKSDAPEFPIAMKRYDLDKMERAVFDGLSGILYADDSQIVRCTHWKEYSRDGWEGVRIQVMEP